MGQDSEKNLEDSNTMQAAWVGIGNFVSFAFTLVSTCVLSRYLTKDDYGTYKQVMYVYNTLLIVFTLGLPKAYSYFLSRCSINEGKSVSKKINIIFFLIGFIFSSILFFCSDIIAFVLNNDNLGKALRLFSLTPLFLLPTMGIEGIMAVYKKNYLNAIYVIATRCLMLLFVALPVALYKSDYDTAIIGFTFSSFLSCLVAMWLKNKPYKGVENEATALTYKEIIRFSLPLAIASLWAIAIKSADQFFISRYFGNEVFADFSNGAIEIPFVGMILGATATVLLPVFSKNVKEEGVNSDLITDLWKRAMAKSAMLIYPIVVYCWVFATPIMTFLYGEKYADSAIYFKVMIIVNLFTIAPYYPIIVALGKTKYYANVHMWNAILIWVVDFIIIKTCPNPYLISVASLSCHLMKIFIMISYISKQTKCKIIQLLPIKELLKLIFVCSFSICIVFYLTTIIPNSTNPIILLAESFSLYIILLLLGGRLCHINYYIFLKPIILKFRK